MRQAVNWAAGLVTGLNRGACRVQAGQAAELLAQRAELHAGQRRADLLDERARIAREIHDVLAHSLGALGIQIQAARAVLTDRGDIAGADELLAEAQRMAADWRRAAAAASGWSPPNCPAATRSADLPRDTFGPLARRVCSGGLTPQPTH
jgi:hypothetical protein